MRAGLPAATQSSPMLLVTTLPAPMIERSPILIPFRMILFAPIQQSSPITTGAEGMK